MIELYVQVESEPINERARLYHTGNTISNHSYIDFIISCSTLYKTWPTRVTNKFYRAFDQYIYICIKCVRRPHFHARIQRERVQISFEINRKIVIFFFIANQYLLFMCSQFFLMVSRGEPCTEYGCPGRPQYEPFVPAPPGHVPNCASPGQTFCESLDHYPRWVHSSDFPLELLYRWRDNATSGNPQASRPISNCWYSFRRPPCPPSAFVCAYEWRRHARVEKNFGRGK